ncbi:MAG: sodium:solute symporter [Myxococcales bacterium]|nr:sodium:solute symporter [Myxococcales bacterium]
MAGTIALIVVYGVYKTRSASKDLAGYLRGGDMRWYTIGLSVMATQASAITFLSTPGQAYEDGMRFVQFYFGLPIAMVILCARIVPVFHKLNVYTAYEYLESRFDLRTRLLTALLFLLQRGFSAGVTIYAPSIILSSALGWPLNLTNVVVGVIVIVYTVSGGTRAVSQTQKHQMIVIMGGMIAAFVYMLSRLPEGVAFGDALDIAGAAGRVNPVGFELDPKTRYTFWSGITGGLFVALAYFGTDQSQVQRYITGGSLSQSRLGLLFNGLLKVPMQAFILLIGVVLFSFYHFHPTPVFWNQPALARLKAKGSVALLDAETSYQNAERERRAAARALVAARDRGDTSAAAAARRRLVEHGAAMKAARVAAKAAIKRADPRTETEDADYIFIAFVMGFLPRGLIGLLLAVILSAAMSSTASELNALGTTTVVDFYKRVFRKDRDDKHYVLASKFFIVMWGVLAILFATLAALVDNLIQAVNILGSIFYGTVLGVFLVGMFLKHVRATPVFVAAIISQLVVVAVFLLSDVGFLWYNVIGCGLVVAVALALQGAMRSGARAS